MVLVWPFSCCWASLYGALHELEELVVEEDGDQEEDDEDQRGADQPCAQLTEVVRKRHPAVGADGIVRLAAQNVDDTDDGQRDGLGQAVVSSRRSTGLITGASRSAAWRASSASRSAA